MARIYTPLDNVSLASLACQLFLRYVPLPPLFFPSAQLAFNKKIVLKLVNWLEKLIELQIYLSPLYLSALIS